MFYRYKWLTKQGRLFEPWIAASIKGNFSSSCAENLEKINVQIICGDLKEVIKSKSLSIKNRISLRLSATLIYGTSLLLRKQIEELYDNCCELFLQTSTKKPYNEMTSLYDSDDTDEYCGADNEENSPFSDRVSRQITEPAPRSFSCPQDNAFDNFVNVDRRPRVTNPDKFIGIKSLRQSVRRSNRISSNISTRPVFNSKGSGDHNWSDNDNTSPTKNQRKKKCQKRRTYKRRIRRTVKHKTKKPKLSIVEKELEKSKELPSPERLRRASDNDSLMSFTFEQCENHEQNHSFQSIGGVNISHHMDKHYMSEHGKEKSSSTCSPVPMDMVSEASDTQDFNLEDFFSDKGNRHCNNRTQSFHVLYPKGMDIKSLKIFTCPISNYSELDQSDVDCGSSTDRSSERLLTTRDVSLRKEFDENGVLSKLLQLWPKSDIVTVRDILNLGSCVTHTGMAAGKIFNSLINLKNQQCISIIKNGREIENIIKGRILSQKYRYHPYHDV